MKDKKRLGYRAVSLLGIAVWYYMSILFSIPGCFSDGGVVAISVAFLSLTLFVLIEYKKLKDDGTGRASHSIEAKLTPGLFAVLSFFGWWLVVCYILMTLLCGWEFNVLFLVIFTILSALGTFLLYVFSPGNPRD